MNPLDSAEGSVKLFVADPDVVDPKEIIPVFHRWIQGGLLEDELLIDVAHYLQVPKGPGVMLVADHGHYYFEQRHGKPGLRFRARRELGGGPEDRLARVFGAVLRAAALLEADPSLEGRCRFRTDELEFGIWDRLSAPSTAETFEAVRPGLERFLAELYGRDAELELKLVSGPREPFLVATRASSAPPVRELAERLASVSQLA